MYILLMRRAVQQAAYFSNKNSFITRLHHSNKWFRTYSTNVSVGNVVNMMELQEHLDHMQEFISKIKSYRMELTDRDEESSDAPVPRFNIQNIKKIESSIIRMIEDSKPMNDYTVPQLHVALQFLSQLPEFRAEQDIPYDDQDLRLLYYRCLQLSEYLIRRIMDEKKVYNNVTSQAQLKFSILCLRLHAAFKLGDVAVLNAVFNDAYKFLKKEIAIYGQKKNNSIARQANVANMGQSISLHLDIENILCLFTVAPHLGLYNEMLFLGDVMKRCYPQEKFDNILNTLHEVADSADNTFDYSAIYNLLIRLYAENGTIENYEYKHAKDNQRRESLEYNQFNITDMKFMHILTKDTGTTKAHEMFSEFINTSDDYQWINIDYELPKMIAHGRAVSWYQMNGNIPLSGIMLQNNDIHVSGFRDLGEGGMIVDSSEVNNIQEDSDNTAQTVSIETEEDKAIYQDLMKKAGASRSEIEDVEDQLEASSKEVEEENEEAEFKSFQVHAHFHFKKSKDTNNEDYIGHYYRKIFAIKKETNEEANILFEFDMRAKVNKL